MTGWTSDKIKARKHFAQIRAQAYQETPQAGVVLAQYADRVIERFMPKSVALFWPYRTEIDTGPLLQAFQHRQIEVSLPVTGAKNTPLTFRIFEGEDKCIAGAYGIPIPAAQCGETTPDLIFAPFLAIDKSGYRLGYGGGYYDRTIAHYQTLGLTPHLIGLGFDAQRVEKVPVGEFDMPLDGVLTPSGLYVFE